MIVLGLGSNVGDREAYLNQAIELLSQSVLSAVSLSPVYESQALLDDNAPESWNQPFLNMAIMGNTDLTPEALLSRIKYIERQMDRQKIGHWSPREIDIDILAYNNELMVSDELTIPHAELTNRAFTLLPFADLAPNWRLPEGHSLAGKTIFDLTTSIDTHGITKTDIRCKPLIVDAA